MLIIFTSGKKLCWKKLIKNRKFKTKIKSSFTQPVLCYPHFLGYLETLHRKYVVVLIIGKNFEFICKKFYNSKILPELGKYNNI